MNSKSLLFSLIVSIILIQGTIQAIPKIKSFQELAQHHCQQFPIQILYRLSSGTLAEKYGSRYVQIDCYVLQFVNEDGQNKQQYQVEKEQEDDENFTNQQQSDDQDIQHQFPQIDPIVQKYAKGMKECLPEDVDPIHATYRIWRFYRFIFQHDYAFQWMRAKIRSTLGYEAQKPNAWMDGEQSAKRLRLDKIFSNEFYGYLDKLMFKDFLLPLMTFLKKNVIVGLEGSLSTSGKPMILQFIESRNIVQEFFKPIIFINEQIDGEIFTYTFPGIPLFFGGSSVNFIWAFSGVLIDRSNIEQIQTVGNKFYHHDIQEWIMLDNVTKEIQVKDAEPYQCKFMHSSYGTIFEKHNSTGKISEYITRWHEDEPKVRNLFSQVFNLIKNTGKTKNNLEFPFNSMLIANQTGLYQYLCQQQHPSYFIYPDLASEPEPFSNRWISNPKKGIFVIANTHLTTINQESYLKKEILSPLQQQVINELRQITKQKVDTEKLWKTVLSISTDPLIKKRLETLIFIYRKAKFVFLPEQKIRKECDQLISILEKWNYNLDSQYSSPVFILWDYFFRQYTFNHVSTSKLGSHVIKHRALTDSYWTAQPDLWSDVISYGQCDSDQWFSQKWDVKLNNTGLNCTCFFNVIRALNRSRQILRNDDGSINLKIALAPFNQKKLIDLNQEYVGTHIQQAFSNFYSKNLGFVAELFNPEVTFLRSYKQIQEKVSLSEKQQHQEESQAQKISLQQL